MRESDALNRWVGAVWICVLFKSEHVCYKRVILFRNNENMIPLEYALKNQARECVPLLITPATVKQVQEKRLFCFCFSCARPDPRRAGLSFALRGRQRLARSRGLAAANARCRLFCCSVLFCYILFADNVNELNERNETPLFRACCAFPESAETVKVI
jgi:hypothetical protein